MGTSSTITIDLATKEVTYSSQEMAIRETVAIALVNTGTSQSANLTLSILYRSTVLVDTDNFVDGVGQFDGTIDLDNDDLIAMFAGLDDPRAKRRFDVTLFDSGRQRLLINDKITIMNNPYDPDMKRPTPIT